MLKIIRIIFYIIFFLFLLDIFDLFQTKLGILKIIIYYGVLVLPIPLLIMEIKTNPNLKESILTKGLLILSIIGILYLEPMKIIFHTATWKTQTVELINENNNNHKVEFQMKDVGALGYVKRNAEIYYLTDYFYVVLAESYDKRSFLGIKWKRIEQNINEIGLKQNIGI